jgi:transposase InsO family protein
MKYSFMAGQRGTHSVGKIAEVLRVSRSGYHAWVGRGDSGGKHAERELEEAIRAVQKEVPGVNRVWVSDITHIPTTEGWLYLAVVMDLCSRRVVGWSMSSR